MTKTNYYDQKRKSIEEEAEKVNIIEKDGQKVEMYFKEHDPKNKNANWDAYVYFIINDEEIQGKGILYGLEQPEDIEEEVSEEIIEENKDMDMEYFLEITRGDQEHIGYKPYYILSQI